MKVRVLEMNCMSPRHRHYQGLAAKSIGQPQIHKAGLQFPEFPLKGGSPALAFHL